jgi:hypothetical protein
MSRRVRVKGPELSPPDGSFFFDCANVKSFDYPVHLRLSSDSWAGCSLTEIDPFMRNASDDAFKPVYMSLQFVHDRKRSRTDSFIKHFRRSA